MILIDKSFLFLKDIHDLDINWLWQASPSAVKFTIPNYFFLLITNNLIIN